MPYDTQEKEIRDIFEEFGKIKNIRMVTDQFTGMPNGKCWVNFAEECG